MLFPFLLFRKKSHHQDKYQHSKRHISQRNLTSIGVFAGGPDLHAICHHTRGPCEDTSHHRAIATLQAAAYGENSLTLTRLLHTAAALAFAKAKGAAVAVAARLINTKSLLIQMRLHLRIALLGKKIAVFPVPRALPFLFVIYHFGASQ